MQYHPHGDASIAEALVGLANKGYLIEGQGNFGNLFTGDPAAASRYIECRLTELARRELFNDEVDSVRPELRWAAQGAGGAAGEVAVDADAGSGGIAVGLSTRVPVAQLRRVAQRTQISILEKKPFELFPDFQVKAA